MKKILALACAALLVTGFISCGPSEEKRKEDSTDVASQKKENDDLADHVFDSINAANDKMMRDDSAKKADSTHKADSAAQGKKKK